MISIFSYEFTFLHLGLFVLCSLLIGVSKTGVHGAGMIAVPLLAIIFGGRASSGLMLPLLIIADIFGVAYYHRFADQKHLWRLFPWAIIGILLGTYIGQSIGDELFRMIMGITIFVSLGIMVWLQKDRSKEVPNSIIFVASMGVLAGFTTMVGNLAGSVMALYLLSMRLPKKQFIGTAAWFFLGMNLFKVPFHIWSWETITLDSFYLNLTCIPIIAIGAFFGIKIVSKISETNYRWFVIAMVSIAAIFMII